MAILPKCQPRSKPLPYKRKPKEALLKSGPGPASSAKPLEKKRRQNLTLYDWLTVFAYIDEHPDETQTDVVNFFRTRAEGALEFTQASLSRRLKARGEVESRAQSNPTALSSKRPRIVTRPDVEEALVLWVRSMELKSEVTNGPMLREKRRRFEEQMGVPDAEQLMGDSWIASFCKAYNIKLHRRHGEAGSVDAETDAARATEAVEKLASLACKQSGLVLKLSLPKPPQLEALEQDLMDSITILKDKNRIFGTPPSVNELLDPLEERENLDAEADVFEDDAAIIAEVRRREAVRNGEAIEVDLDDEDDCDDEAMATSELVALAEKLEAGYVSRVGADSLPDFLHHLRAFRAELRRDQTKNAKQTTLPSHGFVKSTKFFRRNSPFPN